MALIFDRLTCSLFLPGALYRTADIAGEVAIDWVTIHVPQQALEGVTGARMAPPTRQAAKLCFRSRGEGNVMHGRLGSIGRILATVIR